MFECEVWKDIPGYKNEYQASNLGRIRSLPRLIHYKSGRVQQMTGRILKPAHDNYGYRIVRLYHNKRGKTYMVHRIVAQAFICNTNSLPCINHKDGNKDNNRVENLEWCTVAENNLHMREKLGVGAKRKPYRVIVQIDGDEIIAEFNGPMDAARKTGITFSRIYHACQNFGRRAGGYGWKYKE